MTVILYCCILLRKSQQFLDGFLQVANFNYRNVIFLSTYYIYKSGSNAMAQTICNLFSGKFCDIAQFCRARSIQASNSSSSG